MQKTQDTLISVISFCFLISGTCALIYQIAWQRILFASFGADLESMTVIIAAFMLGLGGGALAGGWLADRYPSHTLAFFALTEGGVGAFGCISPDLLRWAGDMTIHAPLSIIASVNFALVLFPTLLMGATLPILVADLARRWTNIGKATGTLYASNTLGATFGALLLGYILFEWVTLDAAIYLAAIGNLSVAAGVFALLFKYTKRDAIES
ncbi:fused MFS/spermidine synthase [Tepidimonas sediminis]|uniref:fused MFS/spermidine synthase n=1 Tax=Tepidimonas sediminis TaxID=2588941 RepID=UPI00117F8AAC|nr:fused MFS/spermidine synthase [Tepidimonas sediminis]